ncbi:hypothetical protein OHS70_19695 [Streptomyces sp. NBC_00390]|uniref:hypothetical protein n=1 Tax=Streptomyces sp. NBC_00390 TaxID=2975736 RepID=UPI002E1C7182
MSEQITAQEGQPAAALPVPAEPAVPAGAAPVVPAQAKDRPGRGRVLRAVARWTVAVLVLGGVGAGTAYGIAGLERTDVPGLATQGDGRWAYPKLSLPALAKDQPRPYTDGNVDEIHYADLRKLLLPAPTGAKPDKKLNGGWVTDDRFAAEYAPDEGGDLRQALDDYAVRHIAARGWTMPDGTRTAVYLLRFDSTGTAESFKDTEIDLGLASGRALAGEPTLEIDADWDSSGEVENTSTYVYGEAKPYGREHTRQAYVVAGDTVALIVQARKGGAAAVPFHQTVILQNQLLG